jgi:diaminopimelate decarboxylase
VGASVLTVGFPRINGALACERVPLARIAQAVGTPTYVYSSGTIQAQHERLTAALDGVPCRVHFSVKANSSLAVLSLLRSLGAGVDIVSGGELHRAQEAGFPGDAIVFSGVGKTGDEMRRALIADVGLFNVESFGELELLDAIAGELGHVAPVAIRVNPEVEVETPHHYTRTGGRGDKFGVPYDEVLDAAQRALELPSLDLVGLDMHVGSQLSRLEPYAGGIERLLELVTQLRAAGASGLRVLDIGGGLAVPYGEEQPVDLPTFAALAREAANRSGLSLIVEPGRFLVAEAGILLTRVLYRKRSGGKDYVVTDAGMTELLRPSHYQSYHRIERVQDDRPAGHEAGMVDVVGPVCESGDFLGLDRALGDVAPGDLLAVHTAGAYGHVMASNYNSRPRPPEVLVRDDQFGVVTERESWADLTRLERVEPVWVH